MSREKILKFIRLHKNFQKLQDFFKLELKNKFDFRNKIKDYKLNQKGTPFKKLESNRIKVTKEDFKSLLKESNKKLENLYFFFKDFEHLSFQITQREEKDGFNILEIENLPTDFKIPDEGFLSIDKYSGDDYQNEKLIESLHHFLDLDTKNIRKLAKSLLIGEDLDSEKNINTFKGKLIIDKEPSENQKLVMDRYLNGGKFLCIIGDAGTGKSTLLYEIIAQEIKKSKKILCLAQSHNLVDEYLNNLLNFGYQEYLFSRLANEDKNIQENLRKYSFQSNFKESYYGTLKKLNKQIEECNDPNDEISEIQREWRVYLNENDEIYRKISLYSSDAVFSTTMGFFKFIQLFSEYLPFDVILIDESSITTFSEFLASARFGKKWILAGDNNQLKRFYSSEIKDLVRDYAKEAQLGHLGRKMIQHLNSIDFEDYFGWNLLKVLDKRKFFQNLDKELKIIELKHNFRLPPPVIELFSNLERISITLDKFRKVKLENVPLNVKSQLKNYIFFKKTDKYLKEANQSKNGYYNEKEAELTIFEIEKIVNNHNEVDDQLVIGVGSAWNDQIDAISNLLRQNKEVFEQIDEKGRRFISLSNKNIKIIIDTFWSLSAKNIDYLIWNFVKCKYFFSHRRNKYLLKYGLFRGLYSKDPNLFNCFLKRFKQKLIIIGNSESFNRYLFELYEYINNMKELLSLSVEIKLLTIYDNQNFGDLLKQLIDKFSPFSDFISRFERILIVLASFLEYSNQSFYIVN